MKIAVLGDLLYDCFIWADRLPRKGETVTGFRNGFFAGGKGGNQAVQAARLGAEVHMIGKVGQDERGRFLVESLHKEGIHTEYVFRDASVDTGTDCVMIDRKGDNLIIVAPLANEQITAEEIRKAAPLIESADILLSQLQINEEAVTEAFKIARAAGVCTVLNPAPAREMPAEYYQLAGYLTPNETEAEFFTGCYQADFEPELWRRRVSECFREKGVRNLIVTLGAQGALYAGEQGSCRVPPYKVDAVDTTAAGDAFNAAFCIRLAAGASVWEAVRYANAAGAMTAAEYGSLPSMPKKEALELFIRRMEEQ